MIIKVAVQNLAHGGLRDGAGNPQDRWPALLERFASAGEVDVFLFCEAVDWGKYGHRQLARAMADLDMDALPLAPSSSGYGTAVLYRRKTMGRWLSWNTDFAQETVHGFGVAAFDIGLPAPLSVVPVHLSPFGADKAMVEGSMVIARAYRNGPFAILGGDVNYPPARGPEPDYAAQRPYNRSARTLLPEAGDAGPIADRRIARRLEQAGLVDAAWHLFEQTGDESLLAKTASDDRVDQLWVSSPLAPAIRSYRLLDDPPGASDHKGLLVEIDTERADIDDVWAYR